MVARTLDELLAIARTIDPPAPHERSCVLRSEAGILLDALIARAARGSGALEIAIGEGLASLAVGNRALRLGYSGIGDYAETVLGIAASTAAKMERRARYLRERPLLRDAVGVGEVEPSKADVVMRVAHGDSEAVWVERAKSETVRALREAVREGVGDVEDEDGDEKWERVFVALSPAARGELDEAIRIARKILGSTAAQWRCIQALLQEFFNSHPVEIADADDVVLRRRVEEWVETLKKHFEKETLQWSFLDTTDAVIAPVPSVPIAEDPWLLDPELRRLAQERSLYDEIVGRAALVFRMLGLWRDAKFASFAHYCSERARMSVRAVEQRIALEKKLYSLPRLCRARREGRITYEKARLVAGVATERTEEDWIAYADMKTCLQLRRELNGDCPPLPPDATAQMLARPRAAAAAAANDSAERIASDASPKRTPPAQMLARRHLDLCIPASVREMLDAAICAIRKAEGRCVSPHECVRRIARHFVETWKEAVEERNTARNRAMERDRGYCLVPGCSREARHSHHVDYSSHGGSDGEENRASLCVVHHLHGEHGGNLRIHGTAPDGLIFELVERPGTYLGPNGPERAGQPSQAPVRGGLPLAGAW